ncbi:MAG: hypothetical protein JOY67_21820 [Hyphomicrobiales bacterium]|nr:hypothetical protein [Hyphomicrobiales bacterium]MBV9115458.1 hypothetical protein [Hyphomicrobiales bacterium]MBV9518724.1 hypothetical protein [Hyphomicrobiales bacterium]
MGGKARAEGAAGVCGAASAGLALGVAEGDAGAALGEGAPPPTALTAVWQAAERLLTFCRRQFKAGMPPVGTLAQ